VPHPNHLPTGSFRVLTFFHSFALGGCERDAMRLVRAWREGGVDARIAVGRCVGPMADEAEGLPIYPIAKPRSITRHFETLWMMARLPRIIARFRPDLIVVVSNNHGSIAVALRALLGAACPPLVLRVSNDLRRDDLKPWVRLVHRIGLRAQARAYDRLIAMAPPARAEIAAEMAVDRDRITVINNASLTQASFDRLARARDGVNRNHRGRNFLAVGRLAPQKNFGLLLDAFARIARSEDRLTIIGEGPLRDSLMRKAIRLGIGNQVFLPGYRTGIEDWLAHADALVLSSDFEGLGNVVVEALAAGVPIVATDCCVNMASLLEGAGLLVPTLEAPAFARAMDTVAHVHVDVAAMRARARSFTVEAATPQWQALFDGFRKANDAAIRPTQLTGVGIQLADTTNWPRAT
jgi:glycosyltransferase involved in cell wall biosynthesis